MTRRFLNFAGVGLLGFLLQIAALACLSAMGWPVAAATMVAVELAVLQNFWWHERWTWRERTTVKAEAHTAVTPHGGRRRAATTVTSGPGRDWDGVWTRLVRFQLTTGVTSIVSNVVLTSGLTSLFGLDIVVANTVAVLLASLANFALADRFVFKKASEKRPRCSGRTSAVARPSATGTCVEPWQRSRRIGVVTTAVWAVWMASLGSAHASPARETVNAWNVYVSSAEAEMANTHDAPCVPGGEPTGEAQGVPGGTIHRWRGCTVLRRFTVDSLLHALMHPGTPPPQEDVLESRVLARRPDWLRVYLKLKRSAVLTVTYDTEHEVSFARRSSDVATSTSVATSISEIGGSDRGFLWRLNSYWRYVQVGPDVRVELESLSLSRTVPLMLRPVAAPIVSSVARESVTRALEALRGYAKTTN